MRTRLNSLFIAFLNVAASTQKLGINLIRVAILVIFVWIGGLKFWNYEAEGIVPFVANSPFMSFFTPEVWVPDLGSGEHGFPLLTGAGRLVIKDTAILAGAIVVLSDSAKKVLAQLKK